MEDDTSEAAFIERLNTASKYQLLNHPYVVELRNRIFDLEVKVEEVEKWKALYRERNEEVERVRIELDKLRIRGPSIPNTIYFTAPPPTLSNPLSNSTATVSPSYVTETMAWSPQYDEVYVPIIDEEQAKELGIYWKRQDAVQNTKSAHQNNSLSPTTCLFHAKIEDEQISEITPLSQSEAEVIQQAASTMCTQHLDRTETIKGQNPKTLNRCLRKLEEKYRSVLCLGQSDWMGRIFFERALKNKKLKVGEERKKVKKRCAEEQEGGQQKKQKTGQSPDEGFSKTKRVQKAIVALLEQDKTVNPSDSIHAIITTEKPSETGQDLVHGNRLKNVLDVLKSKVPHDNAIRTNLSCLSLFVVGGTPPSASVDGLVAKNATEKLGASVTGACHDFDAPEGFDEELFQSEDLRLSPRGDSIGHNSLGASTLWQLREWKNVGSVASIQSLLETVKQGINVSQRFCDRYNTAVNSNDSTGMATPFLLDFNYLGRLAESLCLAWTDGGGTTSSTQSVSTILDQLIKGEYNEANKLPARSSYHDPHDDLQVQAKSIPDYTTSMSQPNTNQNPSDNPQSQDPANPISPPESIPPTTKLHIEAKTRKRPAPRKEPANSQLSKTKEKKAVGRKVSTHTEEEIATAKSRISMIEGMVANEIKAFAQAPERKWGTEDFKIMLQYNPYETVSVSQFKTRDSRIKELVRIFSSRCASTSSA
ncbi:hypothetical protein BT69DRAFT_1330740 [Atractiella rhizophila]|nr:hypothetical protein BT69DRAFT_1330740 [Atractiella rhizophila]